MSGSRTRSSLFAGTLAGLTLLAAGCGGSKTPSVVSLGTTTTTAASGTNATGSAGSPPSQAQLQRDSLKYSECMRASGEPKFPDPSPGGGFQFQSGSGVDPASPAFKTAQAKCQKFNPGAGGPASGPTTPPTAQWLAHMVKVSACMRRHGVPGFPDPRTSIPSNPFPAGGAGVISDIEGVILIFPSTLDMQSPSFTQAAAACGFPLHNH